ncbi:hypothetical protein QQF64_021812 [Cirrhinus molitorella]|uniref:Uncharacterized protein n=1 Tax=Cirrhinus molitorella TaxID=172907 RepID=A0ABR3L6D3_9TELE
MLARAGRVVEMVFGGIRRACGAWSKPRSRWQAMDRADPEVPKGGKYLASALHSLKATKKLVPSRQKRRQEQRIVGHAYAKQALRDKEHPNALVDG